MKNKFKLIMLTLLLLITLSSCASSSFESRFAKIKVGATVDKVTKLLGDPDDYEQLNQYYIAYYWFSGASSQTEANTLMNKGVYVKYYCVILYTSDFSNYYVKEADDIFSGNWGKD